MNPKVTGILLLVVGLGVGLYFINSGAASKLSSAFQKPGASSSTTISAAATTTIISEGPGSTSGSGSGAAAQSSTAASSSAGFTWASFFSSLFGTHSFANIPTVAGLGEGSAYNAGGSGGGGASSEGSSGSSATVTPPAGFTVAQLSPYYGEVHLSGVSQGEITISTYSGYNTPTSTVDITGWEIKTNRGGEFLPQVQDIYDPTGVPVESDIILYVNQANYVNIYSNSAPADLRINSCMGYLNTPQQFNPGFSDDCPQVDTSQLSQFSGACQNYIRSLYSCQSPNFSDPYFPRNDYQCEQYLQGKYTYSWCVSNYASSPNFLSNDWSVWMGATPLDPYHDDVELLDRNGLLVDFYSY